MRNCVVLGSGRSGTSMLAGTLASSGYYLGPDLLPPTASNPKGYYESREVNLINEQLLAGLVPPAGAAVVLGNRSAALLRLRSRRFREGQRWLADIPPDAPAPAPSEQMAERMRGCLQQTPFCLKDPRFSYTVDSWTPIRAANPVFVVVFRHPATTAMSIVDDATRTTYLRDLHVDSGLALRSWLANYRHALAHAEDGEWLFVHFDQILYGDGLDVVGTALGVRLDPSFRDPELDRSEPLARAPAAAVAVYAELCARAGWRPAQRELAV